MSAICDLTSDRHIYCIWFVGGGNADWMACLSKKDGENWVCDYRFRYYEDDKVFDSADRKSAYTAQMNSDSGECRDALFQSMSSQLVPLIEARMGNKADLLMLDCRGDDPKILFEIGSRPWGNIKMVSIEEAKAMGIEVPDDNRADAQ